MFKKKNDGVQEHTNSSKSGALIATKEKKTSSTLFYNIVKTAVAKTPTSIKNIVSSPTVAKVLDRKAKGNSKKKGNLKKSKEEQENLAANQAEEEEAQEQTQKRQVSFHESDDNLSNNDSDGMSSFSSLSSSPRNSPQFPSNRDSFDLFSSRSSIDFATIIGRGRASSDLSSFNTPSKSWVEFEFDAPQEDVHLIDISTCQTKGFNVEIGNPAFIYGDDSPFLTGITIEDSERETPVYEQYFYGKAHINYIGAGLDEKRVGPIAVSFEPPTKEKDTFLPKRAIIRTKKGSVKYMLPPSNCNSASNMLKHIRSVFPIIASMKLIEVWDQELQTDLLKFERQDIYKHFKFGVLNVKEGQTTEEEIFSNVSMSEDFTEFLDTLTDRVELLGFDKYRGGLDVKTNTTGTHSYYTQFGNYEIMLHVAALLPFQEEDEQRVERKRHVGNDVVVIIFKEGNEPFNPLKLTSHFNHVFAVVQLDHKEGEQVYYKVNIANKPGVPPYGPYLPYPSIIEKRHLKNFFFSKLINAERNALIFAPEFKDKLERTRKEQLAEMAKTFLVKNRNKSIRRNYKATETNCEENSSTDVFKEPGKIERLRGRLFSSLDKKAPIHVFKEKCIEYAKSLEDCLGKYSQYEDMDGEVALNSLNQLVQHTAENAPLLGPSSLDAVTNAQNLSIVGSHFIYLFERRKNDKEIPESENVDSAFQVFRETLYQYLEFIEAKTRERKSSLKQGESQEQRKKALEDFIAAEEEDIRAEELELEREEAMIRQEEQELQLIEESEPSSFEKDTNVNEHTEIELTE